jgi:hypothetical protein
MLGGHKRELLQRADGAKELQGQHSREFQRKPSSRSITRFLLRTLFTLTARCAMTGFAGCSGEKIKQYLNFVSMTFLRTQRVHHSLNRREEEEKAINVSKFVSRFTISTCLR